MNQPAAPVTNTAAANADTPPASYAAASAELDELVAAIESGTLDVDALAGAVQRGRYLVTWCKNRVTETAAQITAITASDN